jgi:hypothetical protein
MTAKNPVPLQAGHLTSLGFAGGVFTAASAFVFRMHPNVWRDFTLFGHFIMWTGGL